MIKAALAGRLLGSHHVVRGQVQQPAPGVSESDASLSQKVHLRSTQIPRAQRSVSLPGITMHKNDLLSLVTGIVK